MDINTSQILHSLFIGDAFDVVDPERLKKNSITHVVSVFDNAEPANDEFKFLCINAKDDEREDLSKYFSEVNDFVHEGRSKGGVILHCAMGISRSVTLTIAYIMTVTNLSFDQVLKVVQYRRPIAHPNEGFRQQLQKFGEAENLSREIKRFREKFDIKLDRFDDVEECKRILTQVEKKENSSPIRNKVVT